MNNHNKHVTSKYAVGMFMWRRVTNLDRILEAIIDYSPPALYLYIDGPRNLDDKDAIDLVVLTCKNKLCNAPFPVIWDIATNHLGLNKRFRTGLHNLFTAQPAAIVLEDDTIPSPAFFSFCTFYLSAFEYNNDIVAINGAFKARQAFLEVHKLNQPFTNHIFNPWGWASWSHKILPLYNPDIKTISVWQSINVFTLWWNFDLYQLRRRLLKQVELGILHTWDVQLQWSIFLKRKKVLTSPKNLISNVGNDELASTFVAGSNDFNHPLSTLASDNFQCDVLHLIDYDLELCGSKSNKNYIIKRLRKFKERFFS